MQESSAERAAATQSILAATAAEPTEVKLAALSAMVPAPDQEAANGLWRILLIGLLVLLGIALGGLLFMIGDSDAETSPDLVVTAFSSLLAGLLGLFIKSPTERS